MPALNNECGKRYNIHFIFCLSESASLCHIHPILSYTTFQGYLPKSSFFHLFLHKNIYGFHCCLHMSFRLFKPFPTWRQWAMMEGGSAWELRKPMTQFQLCQLRDLEQVASCFLDSSSIIYKNEDRGLLSIVNPISVFNNSMPDIPGKSKFNFSQLKCAQQCLGVSQVA